MKSETTYYTGEIKNALHRGCVIVSAISKKHAAQILNVPVFVINQKFNKVDERDIIGETPRKGTFCPISLLPIS